MTARLHRFTYDAMACTFGLSVVHAERRYAEQVAQAAFDELVRLEQLLSRFVPNSDIAQLNRLAPGQAVRVSLETLACLQLAAEMYAATDGAFDIAYRSRRHAATAPVGQLVFDPAAHAVGVAGGRVDLDLGAMGKGYAVDRLVALLREWHIEAALVDSGQSTGYAVGQPPDAESWTLSLRDPRDQQTVLREVALRDAALSGSGQALHGGHIIDPRTGGSAQAAIGAWAIAPTAALSDVLATALMILPLDQASQVCARMPGTRAFLLAADEATVRVIDPTGGA